ncbi:hypothetical protein DFH08DRAFT_797024 [Mycena albidolilacea]|uniref:Uncharacterized protein n=1 Tax=Mycena albidolilacea TaxID=1033008 RepID=A0AAD7AWS3_9AGAR|nr:hypothetical protein DFH08DRAFT_797024 [Mycena albidolilacea]
MNAHSQLSSSPSIGSPTALAANHGSFFWVLNVELPDGAIGGMGSDFKVSVAHIVPHGTSLNLLVYSIPPPSSPSNLPQLRFFMASMETTDTTTTRAAGSIIYQKMKVAELKAAGLNKYPVYACTISMLLPLYLAKANDATYQGALVDYVKSDLFNKIIWVHSKSRNTIRMIQDSGGNIGSILNSEGTHLIWNNAHQQTCQGEKWYGEGTDGKAIERTWAGRAK